MRREDLLPAVMIAALLASPALFARGATIDEATKAYLAGNLSAEESEDDTESDCD